MKTVKKTALSVLTLILALCLLLGGANVARAGEPGDLANATEKQLADILKGIREALNTMTLKKYVPAAIDSFDSFLEALFNSGLTIQDSGTAFKKAAIKLLKSGNYAHDGRKGSYIRVTQAAGQKYNLYYVGNDTSTGSVPKEDIPKAAVEKPSYAAQLKHNDHTLVLGTATCSAAAVCKTCGQPYGDKDPNNHDWGEWYDVSATDDQTLQQRVCAWDSSHVETRYVPHVHAWGEWAVTTAPTCAAQGEETRVCRLNSSHRETRTAQPLSHVAQTVPAVAPTCEEPGLTQGEKCVLCGEILSGQTEIPALEHDWGAWMDAEILENGQMLQCLICARNETHMAWQVADAPAPAPGSSPVIPPHTHTGGTATCTEPAVCTACGQPYGRPLGHTPETVPGRAAACTQPGLTAGEKCADCGKTLVKQQEIPALGHAAETIPAVAATCTEPGLTAGERCNLCGVTLKGRETVPALGHTPKTVPAKAPTCETSGWTEGKQCAVCGVMLSGHERILPKGHEWGLWYPVLQFVDGHSFTHSCKTCTKSFYIFVKNGYYNLGGVNPSPTR